MLEITPSINIDDSEIEETFTRAPGPGGQRVNKVETAVQLRFDARQCRALPNAVFLRLKRLAGQRMTQDGIIIITANQFRSQERNRKDARERLIDLIKEAAIPPKFRRSTKPTKGSRERRLDSKRQRSDTKKHRGRIRTPD